MHWGGGTPNFLNHDEMTRADAGRSASTFSWTRAASIRSRSIRAARRRTPSTLLAQLGFNRMSLGVQDFDPVVQRAVNRIQSEEQTRAVIEARPRAGFQSVNVDLIYGLPKQNVIGFNRTLEKVDRCAARSHRALQLRPPAGGVQAAAAHRRGRPACARRQAAAAVAGDPSPERGGLRLHRHGPLRQAGRRSRRGAAPGPAAPQFPGLFDVCGLRSAGLRRLRHRTGRADLQPERQDPRRVLRPARSTARCRSCAGSS